MLARVDRILDLSWLREDVSDCYCPDDGRPGIDPEVAVRLMLARWRDYGRWPRMEVVIENRLGTRRLVGVYCHASPVPHLHR
jgi:hypothetical protein